MLPIAADATQDAPDTPRRVKEFETIDVDVDDVVRDSKLDVYPSIRDRDYIRLSINSKGTTIQARGHVGLIPVNDRLTLEVIPRTPLGNLSRLLDVSRKAPTALADAIRFYDTEGEMYPSLAGVYAAALRQQIERIS